LDFDIVIATRNRRKALQLSLPPMLTQRRLPSRLIVVDASDDHGETRKTVENIVADTGPALRLEIIRSEPGSSRQRNAGLKLAKSPVVLFPDDDSLWFPGFSDALMRVYERDEETLIGGVGGRESPVPPPGVLGGEEPSYRMAGRDRLQLSVGRFLDSIEYRLFPDPFFVEGAAARRGKRVPPWLAEEESGLEATLPGFRMSFRTELILKKGFDQALGTYALFEDYDASLAILETHLLVDAGKAKVFHYRVPGDRVAGAEWGAMQILNRAYVICKHSRPGSSARKRLLGYSCYKLVRYLAQAHTPYGRQRVMGAAKALRCLSQLFEAPPEKLPGLYALLRERCLSHLP